MINGFTLHDTTSAPADSTGILDGVQKFWGLVTNLHRVLAESPAALEAYATLWSIAEKTGSRRRSATSPISQSSTRTNARIAWPATRTCRACATETAPCFRAEGGVRGAAPVRQGEEIEDD
jgi:hypothetical protein